MSSKVQENTASWQQKGKLVKVFRFGDAGFLEFRSYSAACPARLLRLSWRQLTCYSRRRASMSAGVWSRSAERVVRRRNPFFDFRLFIFVFKREVLFIYLFV